MDNKSILTFVYIILWILILTFPGCESRPPKPKHPTIIKIGAIYPFTGHSASTGEDLKAALDLASEIINHSNKLDLPLARDKGLPGHGNAKIQVVYKNSRGDEIKAIQLIEELVNGDKVVAVLGCYNSAVTAAASEQAEVLKIPFLNPESTSPVLTQRGLKWFFRTTPDDRMFAQNFFTFFNDLYLKMNIEVPKKLILVYENRLWGTSVSRAERKLAMKYHYQITGDVPYDAKADILDEELRRIKAALPGVILQSSYVNDAILLIKGYRDNGINPTAVMGMNAGFISPSFLKELGRDAEYVLSREVWAVDIGRKKKLVTTVNRLFNQRFGRNMNGNSARAFTGLLVLADAINRARTLKPEDIRRAIKDTEISGEKLIMPWEGVRFDPETGQNILGKGIIVQVQGGEYRTVWPWELSETRVVWPIPAWDDRDSGK